MSLDPDYEHDDKYDRCTVESAVKFFEFSLTLLKLPKKGRLWPQGLARLFRFWPCLLACLILSQVAIVIGSPVLHNFDINEPRVEVAESSSGPRLTEADKATIKSRPYRPRSLPPTVFTHFTKFDGAIKGNFKMTPKSDRSDHPDLPLAMAPPQESSERTGRVVRISHLPRTGRRSIVEHELLSQYYKKLLFFVEVSHNIILDRYNILQESRQLSLTEDLFEWMHKQTLGDEKDICPLLGIIKIPCCTWTYLSTQMPHAQTQKELATYLAGAATDDHARETAYEVVNGYLAQHKEKYLKGN
ncbi:hypothetical protein PCANC_16693 [Puccinia coronata f. sp. avenae]|uniref:Uncharacterized protein n=1 Tax=Puccinia coronata f. sp. avenae TaxID=200324 RepID=A0A2N5SJD4_9BASI|nr:hypothetical protein PCANC_16693 [Puccinia coronata f. sp. avenae]